MPDGHTPNFDLTLIDIGGSRDTWGDKLNANMTAIDTELKDLQDAVPTGNNFPTAPTVASQGVVPHFADVAITGGRIFITAVGAADPTSQPGDLWLAF